MEHSEKKSISDYTTDDDESACLKKEAAGEGAESSGGAADVFSMLWKQTGLSSISDTIRTKRSSYHAQQRSAAVDRQILQDLLDSKLKATVFHYGKPDLLFQHWLKSKNDAECQKYQAKDLYTALCNRLHRHVQAIIETAEYCATHYNTMCGSKPSPERHKDEIAQLQQVLEILQDHDRVSEVEDTVEKLFEKETDWCLQAQQILGWDVTKDATYRPVRRLKDIIQQDYALSPHDRVFIHYEKMHTGPSCTDCSCRSFTLDALEWTAEFFNTRYLFSCGSSRQKRQLGHSCDLLITIRDIAEYDGSCVEGSNPYITEWILTLDAELSSKSIADATKLVVLGGLRRFRQRLPDSPLSRIFPEYKDGAVDEGVEFVRNKLLDAANGRKFELYIGELGDPELLELIERRIKESATRRRQQMLDTIGYSET
ncbi:hypothetical protein VHEMI05786 [[Torrubiella] hemipterigena]|uniref:Uncharacterized protein n=1 Tax=[Torrubiella] hemipterigena TaxID=1531966 RepID=A0A0A1TJK3_9HYPO|nr:hypothetical protein VHEMI05786 [[Torrubiella] hemipterigena]